MKCTTAAQCVKWDRTCDGETHCSDGSDEKNCGVCKGTAWKCGTSRQCIKSSQRCDGNTDCTNGSDEQNCV
ncbi:hypothetical protein V1264_024550 [Littorina saxatilis]|uniref:Uncharacterized protein n=1 Tax=Littorina saxatilis TaxID=31220 RepID=A0AAN9AMH1_9CAEN